MIGLGLALLVQEQMELSPYGQSVRKSGGQNFRNPQAGVRTKGSESSPSTRSTGVRHDRASSTRPDRVAAHR